MPLPRYLTPALAALTLALAAPQAAPVLASLAGPATAQEAPTPEVTIDDARLDAFVSALRAVDAIEQTYTEAFSEAESDAAREAVIAEANEAMVGAIEETPGITLEEYLGVLQQAQVDPDLNARIMAMLQG